jgi:RHS repeat-associated protein
VNYDANGNQIGDQVYTNYVWNVENRMVQQLTAGSGGTWYGGTGYSYDPSGRRVMKNVNPDPAGTNGGTGYSSGTWEFYFYGLNGRKIGTIDCYYDPSPFGNWPYMQTCGVTGQNTYFAGKMIVEMGSAVAMDRLGSVRANGGLANIPYFPYGAEQTPTTEGSSKFGTYIRDAVGQDYAEQRYYNAGMGRFWSPDRIAGNISNPGSLNKYAYVQGDPVNFNDPRGTDPNCGPGMSWDGEGCTQGATLNGAAGYAQTGAPCGQDWVTNAGESGPCQNPCSGVGFGEDFVETPNPGCDVPEPSSAPPTPSCSWSLIVEQGAAGYHTPFTYHTVIQITAGDGDLIDYEAFPIAKTAAQNPYHLPPLFGGSWLNKSETLGNVQGTVDDSGSGCAAAVAIGESFNSWQNSTTSYYFYPQNSNSFVHWILNQAGIQLSAAAAQFMSASVAGWNWNPSGQGN